MGTGNGQIIHAERLIPSSKDDVSLGDAVEQRFLELCGTHLRILGVQLYVPRELYKDVYHWREMRVRHKSGDLRHTDAEMRSTQAVGQWTVDINRSLRNQPARKIEWR